MAELRYFVWERADARRVVFELKNATYLVGRDESCDIHIDEPLVSRAHARLELRPEGWVVVDLGSTNYTRVNGVVVTEWLLNPGDEVRFGRSCCRFQSADGTTTEPPAAQP